MDLDRLKDLKIEDLIKKPLFLFQIGIIIFSFVAARRLYMYQAQKNQEIKLEIQNEKDIESVIADIQKLKARLDDYKSMASPYNDTSFIINTVSQYANQLGIRFGSIRPQSIKEIDPYAYLSLSLSSQMDSFKQLGTFISLVENSPKFLQIDVLRFSNTGSGVQDKQATQAEMVVSSYYLK